MPGRGAVEDQRFGIEHRFLERFRVEMSGAGAPGLTATPIPTRPTLARSWPTFPALAKFIDDRGRRDDPSWTSPSAIRLRIAARC
jgi:hypothetical protein